MSADEPKLPKSRDKRRVPTSERNVGWTSQQTSADSQNHVTDEEHGISMSEEDSNNQRYWTLEKTEKKEEKKRGAIRNWQSRDTDNHHYGGNNVYITLWASCSIVAMTSYRSWSSYKRNINIIGHRTNITHKCKNTNKQKQTSKQTNYLTNTGCITKNTNIRNSLCWSQTHRCIYHK